MLYHWRLERKNTDDTDKTDSKDYKKSQPSFSYTLIKVLIIFYEKLEFICAYQSNPCHPRSIWIVTINEIR